VELLQRVRDREMALHSLIVLRHGRVVVECYLHPYDAGALHNVKSVSKSFMSALTGIALQRGILNSLDQRVVEFFPNYLEPGDDPRKRQISLRHLLTMTPGLELDESGGILMEIFRASDWIWATLQRPMLGVPGTRFAYSTFVTHLMSGILTEASGKNLLELMSEHLFRPLGIEEAQWARGPRGYNFGGAELFLAPRSMAKLGQLYLNHGRWKERQVVPSAWVRESTHNQLGNRDREHRYGYWWWIDKDGGYRAKGWGGQAIIVKPRRDMVVVVTSGDPAASDEILATLDDYEPADRVLPPAPGEARKLRRLVRELKRPARAAHTRLPDTARRVSGRRYLIRKERSQLRALALEFHDSRSATLSLEKPKGVYEFAIGLDNRYRITESGSFGPMPDHNRAALRGAWTDDHTFTIDSHDLGSPLHERMVIRFVDDSLRMKTTVMPIGATSEVLGVSATDGS
jgi:CubicO group peptidase (beta-lactamase class C family)